MGCLGSKESEMTTSNEEPKFSWDRDDRPDPKDFTIEHQTGVICGRKPGTVNGQQFIINNCKDSSIYIFDHTATVTIDNCENCNIFIGPTKGSIFLRNCKNIQGVMMCQQYRTRDCRKVETFLSCATQPIIESSASMKFGCFQFYYLELDSQMEKAGLSPFNNTWYSIHDFTPIQDGNNWSLIPESVSVKNHLPHPSSDEFQGMEISYDKSESSVPVTRGTKRTTRYADSCLMVFFQNHIKQCKIFLNKLSEAGDVDIIQSKEIKMTVDDAERIFKNDRYRLLAEHGSLVGFELNGDDVIRICENILNELGISLQEIFLSPNKERGQKDVDAFYNYVDMTMS